MKWILFKYEDGSNPYIAKTEKEAKRMMDKYKNRIEKIKNDCYFIRKENKKELFPLF